MANENPIQQQITDLFTVNASSIFELYENTKTTTSSQPSFTDRGLKKDALLELHLDKDIAESVESRRFSHFIFEHMVAARNVYMHFMKIADENEGEKGVEMVMKEFQSLVKTKHHPDLLYYALMVFLTHHPKGQSIRIPSIEKRLPELLIPSSLNAIRTKGLAKSKDESLLNWYREDPLMAEHHEHWHVVFPITGIPDKYGNPKLKDRHGELFFYMHRQMLARYDTERLCAGFERVIPFDNFDKPILEAYDPGYVTSDGYLKGYDKRDANQYLQDTQIGYTVEGQQFKQERLKNAWTSGYLKRYQVNEGLIRQLNGLNPGEEEVIFRYLVDNEYVIAPGDLNCDMFNPDDAKAIIPLPKAYKKYEKPLAKLIREGYSSWPIDANLLGDTVETNINSIDTSTVNRKNAFYYGNFHGAGHVLSALINKVEDEEGNEVDPLEKPGVMFNTTTAQRDPFFYRWHKEVDNQWYNWEIHQKPADFSDYPNVSIRKVKDSKGNFWSPDIILVKKSDWPGADTTDWNGQAEGEMAFGNDRGNVNFDRDFSKGSFNFKLADDKLKGFQKTIQTTDTLETYMDKRNIHYKTEDGGTKEVEINYLNHDDFFYFIRVENKLPYAKKVTIRIFLCLDQDNATEDRRMWIEMDKFVHELAALEKGVIFRPSDQSSVVRKPAIKDPKNTDIPYDNPDPNDPDNEAFYYCECGWPYSLLLPRGTQDGQSFQLMVMVTDYDIDRVEDNSCCGSMSYCGAKDKYPDTRPMGYPFHVPFSEKDKGKNDIANFFENQPNIGVRKIQIKDVTKGKEIA